MKASKIVLGVLIGVLAIAAGTFFYSRPKPEQVFRANLTDAQKALVTLRRAETAYQQSSQGYKYLSAKKSGGKMIYSGTWSEMKLPEVDTSTGFDYECLPAKGVCQATETGKTGPEVNGIRIDIESGVYSCLGSYRPMTTEGFDGSPVVVACQAS